MDRRSLRGAALVLLLAAGNGAALAGDNDLDHYTTPGWYRVIEWLDDDGESVIDGYIEKGPFADREACEKSVHNSDPEVRVYCDYFDSDPGQ